MPPDSRSRIDWMAPSAAVVSATDPETVPETEMLVDAVTSTVPTESVVADAGPS